jgi:hypothetical protein
VTAWDTDLGRWRLAWVEYLRGGANSPEIPDGSVETADDAFAREIALAHEICHDEIEADAAVGVMPPAALVYAEPGGVA